MPKESYTLTLTRFELEYIIVAFQSDQEELAHEGYSYDFLNKLIDKLDSILNKED